MELLIAHPGGPFWATRHEGAWTIPKGLVEAGESPQAAASREFREELGHPAPDGPWIDLGEVTQKAGKTVHAFAVEGDLDPAEIISNEIEIEFPRGSGRLIRFPEIDRAAWVSTDDAVRLLNPAQAIVVERLRDELRL